MEYIYSNRISIQGNGKDLTLLLVPTSGKIIYRDKIDTIIGIKHPGIVLGNDMNGNTWIIHNHYQLGHPEIVTLNEFSNGVATFTDNRPVFYDTVAIIERAISHWMERKAYNWLFNNCQHFVNRISQNKNYSDSIENVSNNFMLFGGLLSLLGFMTSNKSFVKAGFGISCIGTVGKVISKS